MQISGQNQQQAIPQYNSSYNCACTAAQPVQNQPARPVQSQPVQPSPGANPGYNPPYYTPQVTTTPGASGVNIQIFNPSVSPPGALPPTYNVNAPNYYPANYYTNQMGQPCQCGQNNGINNEKKTEKKRVVVLNDEYIKNLENLLNSQDKSQRITAAKQVFERLDEDPSRKDDKALTALINKMLQDPIQEVRLLALSALEGRIVNGDEFTVNVLKQMQANPQGYGYDAADASRILLDMSAQRADKDVPFDPDKRTTIKTEEKKDDKKKSQIKSNNK